jgi:hypothetical protein
MVGSRLKEAANVRLLPTKLVAVLASSGGLYAGKSALTPVDAQGGG